MADPTSSASDSTNTSAADSNASSASDSPIIIPPGQSGPYIQNIVLQPGTDTETGVYGMGYSPDNGAHFYVISTIYGRKYRQEDADRLWTFLQPKIEELIDEKLNKSSTDGNSRTG